MYGGDHGVSSITDWNRKIQVGLFGGGHAGGGRDVGFLDGELRDDDRAEGPLEHRAFLRVSHSEP